MTSPSWYFIGPNCGVELSTFGVASVVGRSGSRPFAVCRAISVGFEPTALSRSASAKIWPLAGSIAVMCSLADSPGRTVEGTNRPLNLADEPLSWKLATLDFSCPMADLGGQSAMRIFGLAAGASWATKSLLIISQ